MEKKIFSSVNESTWEHLKLLFFPILLTTIIGYFYLGKEVSNFLCSKTIGITAAILGEFIAYLLIVNKFKCNFVISIIILITILTCFIIFTFNTPELGIFKDPVTGKYGKY